MIIYDLHTHVLPCMDDGARDVSESLEMLRSSREQGVMLCAATSHCIIQSSEQIDAFAERRQERFEMLRKGISETDFPVPHIILGAEVYMDHDLSVYPNIKKLCYENTDSMLIELTNGIDAQMYSEWIYSLSLLGIKPLIAHVHRYNMAHELIRELDGIDVFYQINCSNLLTFKGRKQTSKFLDTNKRFIISSDMHNTTSRVCNVEKAYKKSLNSYPNMTENLFYLNAKKFLGIV